MSESESTGSQESQIRRLLGVLESEERVYLDLREHLQSERHHMAALDADSLARVVEAKEMCAAEARFLEESRIEVTSALARDLGLASERPTLSEISAALGAEGRVLSAVRARLAALLAAIRELVDANASFAGDSLCQVRDTLRLFGTLVPGDRTYGADARGRSGPATGQLVRRSA